MPIIRIPDRACRELYRAGVCAMVTHVGSLNLLTNGAGLRQETRAFFYSIGQLCAYPREVSTSRAQTSLLCTIPRYRVNRTDVATTCGQPVRWDTRYCGQGKSTAGATRVRIGKDVYCFSHGGCAGRGQCRS